MFRDLKIGTKLIGAFVTLALIAAGISVTARAGAPRRRPIRVNPP
jgi:hypothetical protein